MTRKKMTDTEESFIQGKSPSPPTSENQSSDIGDGVMQALSKKKDADKPKTIRFTADLPEALHKRLHTAANDAGKSKVELLRDLLDAVLP